MLCRPLRSAQFIEAAQRQARRQARHACPQHLGIEEEAVVSINVRELSPIPVGGLRVAFEPDVSLAGQLGQLLSGLLCKGRGCVESGTKLWRINAEKADTGAA